MDDESIRDISFQLFGNRYLLEVGTAIESHPKERFIQKDVVLATGLDKALVGAALKKLERGYLITRLTKEGREQPYSIEPSVLWSAYTRFLEELRLAPLPGL